MANTGDILLTASFDLQIVAGDLAVGDGTAQHQQCLLLAAKGDYKQSPLIGVDLFRWLNDERPDDMMRELRLQFVADGMEINRLKLVPPSEITIDASYK